jgi:hypothetical protein
VHDDEAAVLIWEISYNKLKTNLYLTSFDIFAEYCEQLEDQEHSTLRNVPEQEQPKTMAFARKP